MHLFSHHKKHPTSNSPQADGSTNSDSQHDISKQDPAVVAPTPKKDHKDHHLHGSNSPYRTESPAAMAKYLADNMRSSPRPEHVGEYVDPMGGSINQTTERDPMSTGA
ncbi:hypothetical protein NQZ79_g4349 [Umbelopsis isabellina]|nr:hypothetical protein NQZ79_g4349 [Umbelopsis isabellina]